VVLTAVVLAVVTLLVVMLHAQLSRTPIDPETLCPKDGEPLEYWSVLIDGSDPLSPTQKTFVNKYLQQLQHEIPKHARYSLFVITDPELKAVEPLLSLCNPGDGSDASFFNANPRELARRWQERFADPLAEVVLKGLDEPPSPTSPIIEMMVAVAVASFPIPTHGQAPRRRLIVVSDMLQNSTQLSHYQYDGEELAALADQSTADQLVADLSGVEVEILYLIRRDATAAGIQGLGHIRFWERFLARCGAVLEDVRRVSP